LRLTVTDLLLYPTFILSPFACYKRVSVLVSFGFDFPFSKSLITTK
jgi:hypothetical protein